MGSLANASTVDGNSTQPNPSGIGTQTGNTRFSVASNGGVVISLLQDSTPPTIPILTPTNTYWSNKLITITASSTDTETGVCGFQYSWDNASWTGTLPGIYTNTTPCVHTLYCRAID